jgi:hypothetical protein
MLERSRIWVAASKAFAGLAGGFALALAGCATTEPVEPAPSEAKAPPASTVAQKPPADPRARAEEARALVAQAETDIQRARARRALWSKAWEALVGARAALAADDAAGAIRQARRASELAQLGLEQLAYPAVKTASRSSP